MPEDIREIKKRITEEWLKSVPHLSAFAPNKLYRIVGCSVIGIELIKLPFSEEYRPHFVVYALWKIDVKKCLDAPVLMKQLYTRKGLQFNIQYLKHSTFFNEAVECLKIQIPHLFCENMPLTSIFDLVDNMFNDNLIKSNSAEQAKLFEFKFYVALYVGSQSQMQIVLEQIEQARRTWNMQMFETWYGKFDLWFHGLQEKIDNREDFFAQVALNKQEKKISRLKRSELIEYFEKSPIKFEL